MRTITSILLLLVLSSTLLAQKADPDDPQNIEKGQKLIQQAADARGGAKFLGFTTVEAIGQWTPFDQGLSTVPVAFLDYLVLPNKERTEFGRGKKRKDRKINVNVADSGWVYDGEAETLKDQTEKQVKDFLDSREADLDWLMRSALKDKEYLVRFYGREETRPGERADIIQLKTKWGREFYLMIDPYTKLPVRLAYEKSEGQGTVKYEFRFNQYVEYDGVKFPNIVDLYQNGIQISRVNYQSIKLNVQIPDALFERPASAKAIK